MLIYNTGGLADAIDRRPIHGRLRGKQDNNPGDRKVIFYSKLRAYA